MKYYIITFYNVDTEISPINCANGGLYSHKLYQTKEDAIKARDELIDEEIETLSEIETCFPNKYFLNDKIKEIADIYVDWYYYGNIVYKAVYQIEEVEL